MTYIRGFTVLHIFLKYANSCLCYFEYGNALDDQMADNWNISNIQYNFPIAAELDHSLRYLPHIGLQRVARGAIVV